MSSSYLSWDTRLCTLGVLTIYWLYQRNSRTVVKIGYIHYASPLPIHYSLSILPTNTLQHMLLKNRKAHVSRMLPSWMWHLTAVSYKCTEWKIIKVDRCNSNVNSLLPDNSVIHNHENLKHHTADISCLKRHTRGMCLSQWLVLKCVGQLSYHRKCAG